MDLASALALRADLFGDDDAVIQGGTVLSWTDLDDQSSRLAGFFTAHGVGPGDRVAIGTTNRPEYLLALLAAVKLRAVPVNVNFRYREGELAQMLTSSRSVVLVHDSALAAAVPGGCAAAPLVRLVLSAEPGAGPGAAVAGPARPVPFTEALRSAPIPRQAPAPDAEWLLFTGGTTGLPKAVVQPQRSVVHQLSVLGFGMLGTEVPEDSGELERVLRYRHGERPVVLAGPPLMHATGLYNTLAALLAGGTAVLLTGRRFDPAELLAEVGRRRVTDVVIVGDAFALPIADALDAAAADGLPYNLSSLRKIGSVGANWSPAVKRRLLRHGDFVLSDMLAATEGGPFAMSLSDRRTPDAQLSAFRLVPGARLLPVEGAEEAGGAGPDVAGVLAAPAAARRALRGRPRAHGADLPRGRRGAVHRARRPGRAQPGRHPAAARPGERGDQHRRREGVRRRGGGRAARPPRGRRRDRGQSTTVSTGSGSPPLSSSAAASGPACRSTRSPTCQAACRP